MVTSPVAWLASAAGLGALACTRLALSASPAHRRWLRAALSLAIAVAVAILVTLLLTRFDDPDTGSAFFVDYVQESVFAMDTTIAFGLIVNRELPEELRARAAIYGVLGTTLLLALFVIIVGDALSSYQWLLFPIGVVIIYVAVKVPGAKTRRHRRGARGC